MKTKPYPHYINNSNGSITLIEENGETKTISSIPPESIEQTKQLTYPSIESQKQFWIEAEAIANNATPETRGDLLSSRNRFEEIANQLFHERDELLSALTPFALAFKETTPVGSIPDENIWIWKPSDNRRETHGISRAHLKTAACLVAQLSTTADPKPEDIGGNELPDRIEANDDWCERNDFDRGDLRDEGRNPDGEGESYAARNL